MVLSYIFTICTLELYLVIVVEEDDTRSVTDSVAVLTSAEPHSQSVCTQNNLTDRNNISD